MKKAESDFNAALMEYLATFGKDDGVRIRQFKIRRIGWKLWFRVVVIDSQGREISGAETQSNPMLEDLLVRLENGGWMYGEALMCRVEIRRALREVEDRLNWLLDRNEPKWR